MCLAIPAKVVTIIDELNVEVETFGSRVTVNTALVDGPRLNDFVLVHAGFVLEIIDETAARESLALWQEIRALEQAAETGA